MGRQLSRHYSRAPTLKFVLGALHTEVGELKPERRRAARTRYIPYRRNRYSVGLFFIRNFRSWVKHLQKILFKNKQHKQFLKQEFRWTGSRKQYCACLFWLSICFLHFFPLETKSLLPPRPLSWTRASPPAPRQRNLSRRHWWEWIVPVVGCGFF